MRNLLALLFLCATTAHAQFVVVSYRTPATNGFPGADDWVCQSALSTNVPPGWSTNMTESSYVLASDRWRTNLSFRLDSAQRTNTAALLAAFNRLATYEASWLSGTNFSTNSLNVILRDVNGALLRMRPLLRDLP